MYADRITGSMQRCIEETNRRREVQRQYNEEHGITPQTIVKSIEEMMLSTRVADARLERRPRRPVAEPRASYADEVNLEEWAKILEQEMREAAARWTSSGRPCCATSCWRCGRSWAAGRDRARDR
jgi:excinuclease ABC subunit B